uniref:SH3 domain-containing protein n=1 Tax=Steinernema glaseri TaxID=37863 RepID=A0A1I7ZMF7_9BILA
MHDLQQYHQHYEPSSSCLAEMKLRKSATSTGFQGNAIMPPENGQRRRRRLPKRPDAYDASRLPMSFSCYDQSNAITFDEAERIWMAQSIEQFKREQAAAAAYEMEKSAGDQYSRPQDLFLGHPRASVAAASPVRRAPPQNPRQDGVLILQEPMWNEKKEGNLQCSLNGPADLSAPRHVNKPAATSGAGCGGGGLAPAAYSSRPTKQAEKGDGEAASEKCVAISVPPVEQSPPSRGSARPTLEPFAKMSSSVDSSQRMPVRNEASLDGGAYCDFDSPLSPPNILPSPARSHRRLPPLPIKSSSAALLSNLGRPFNTHFSMPTPPSIHGNVPPANAPAPRSSSGSGGGGGTQLCFGMDTSAMFQSIGGMEDGYYEEDGLNGNQQITTMRQTSFFAQDDSSGVSSCCTGSEHLNPTHRVQSTFIPRHDDEVLLEIGDAVHVERESEDHWCYGTNLRTHQHGIFPSAHVCEIDIVDEICMGALPSNATKMLTDERDTFYLTMLASIEVAHHKGNDVLVQAMNKVLTMYQNKEEIIVPQTVLMEISFRGIHIIDKRKKNFFRVPTFDFFYSLQNISFCGAHPKQLRYFGFITKHPLLPRFACHVFLSNESTQAIVESIGRAFKRSYDEYMAFAHPTEDIYIE